MAAPPVTTTPRAYELARKLVDEFEGRKQREKELNVRKEAKKKEKAESKEGPSRTVTQIDYKKHENTVKELDRQEKEEVYQRKKEEASQWCTLDHEHGPNCRRPVGGCSHDHQKEWQIYEKSTEEKIKAADTFRQEGNEAYRKHNYGLAAVHYRKALLQFDYTFAEGEEEEKAVDAVKVPCLLNLAACKCQQEEWDEVLTHCRLALEVNPRSVKAYYRTGLAHLARDHFEEAKDALMSAYEIEPKNSDVIGALKRLKENMANYKVRRKEVFKGMVAGGGGEEEEKEEGQGAGGGVEEAKEAGARATAAELAEEVADEAMAAALGASATSAGASLGGAGASGDTSSEVTGDADSDAAAAVAPAEGEEGMRRRRQAGGESGGAATAASTPSATSASGKAARKGGDEDDEEDDAEADALNAQQRRMLNYILLGAAGLALTSVGVCAFLYLADAGER